jgi:hypothetical protein
MRATAGWTLAALVALGACAGRETPLPIPAMPLSNMTVEHRVLSVEGLARDAADPGAMSVVLDDTGFATGAERTYAGPGDDFSLAISRILAFDDPEGARAYLAWLETHASTLIGAIEPLPPLDLPGSPFLVMHRSGGCCPKAVPIYASAWRRGATVLYLQASGRGADPEAFEGLARDFDAAVSGAVDA